MWGVLGQRNRCAGSSADWPFSAGMTNEAPLSRRLAEDYFFHSPVGKLTRLELQRAIGIIAFGEGISAGRLRASTSGSMVSLAGPGLTRAGP